MQEKIEPDFGGSADRLPDRPPDRLSAAVDRPPVPAGQPLHSSRWKETSWRRRLALFAGIIAASPAILTILYLPGFVHPVSTLMAGRWLSGKAVDRRWVGIESMAPVLIHSVIMSEDGKFCAHFGVDFGELNAVINDAIDGEKPRGASTITMQTVKNLFLSNSRSILRKAAEIPLAFHLDLVMPKRRIMEIYLNIAEWGEGIFGAEAAARHYFGRSAAELTPRQAALLAAALPNPIARIPAKPSGGLSRLALAIEKKAQQAGGYVECAPTD